MLAQQDVDFLLDPILVVGRVGLRGALEDKAAKVGEVVDEVEQLADVVSDRWTVRIYSLQVLFVDFANACS